MDIRAALQAYVHEAEFDAWLAGQPSPNICTSLDQLQQQQQQQLLQIQQQLPYQEQQQLVDIPGFRRLVLFSLNDYMGLSAHPDVRAATAAAAQQVNTCWRAVWVDRENASSRTTSQWKGVKRLTLCQKL
jgi:hypothetical protein